MLITSLYVQPHPRKGLQEASKTEEIWVWKDSRGSSVDEKGKTTLVPPHSGPLFL